MVSKMSSGVRVGSYELLDLVGEGSFGCVYRARHATLGRRAAVKQSKYVDGEEADLFFQEAKILARLNHYSVPALFDYLVQDGAPYMVLSWAPGATLERILQVTPSPDGTLIARTPLHDEHVLWVLDRLLESLDYLHLCGVFHGDVKPANFIVDVPNHGAVLTDFTVAVAGAKRDSIGKGGTPGYTAPEILSGMPPIAESDIWAAAKVAIAMMGGDPCTGIVPADAAAPVRDLLNQMLRADPTSRPRSAAGVRKAVREARETLWKRTSTREALKFRDGTVWSPPRKK